MASGRKHMPVTVYIPTPFRRMAGNQTYVKAEGKTVGEVLDRLGNDYPGLKQMIYDERDEIPGHINIYVNNQEIHSRQAKETPAGGARSVPTRPPLVHDKVRKKSGAE